MDMNQATAAPLGSRHRSSSAMTALTAQDSLASSLLVGHAAFIFSLVLLPGGSGADEPNIPVKFFSQ